MYDKCVECFEGVIRHSGGLIERVVLDVEGESVYGILHLPANRIGKVPAMLFFPGMDMFKEEFPNAECNPFTRRGIAMLTLDDGPRRNAGQRLQGHRREIHQGRQGCSRLS